MTSRAPAPPGPDRDEQPAASPSTDSSSPVSPSPVSPSAAAAASRGGKDGRRALGAEGEARAARFLARRGYRILERNIRAGGVEVDLIAQRGRLVVFVEVKTRRTQRQGAPELAVDGAKQARLVRAAGAWLSGCGKRFGRARFDVIACLAPSSPGGEWRIDHIQGAFEAGDGSEA